MNEKNIILRILDETKIISSALKVKNIDVAQNALDNREILYREYGGLSEIEKRELKESMKNEIDKIMEIDLLNRDLIKNANEFFKKKFKENSIKKAKLKKGNIANQKYLNPYEKMTTSRFDAKF